MGYLHFDTVTTQVSKKPAEPSGDVVSTYRDKISTLHVICDGMGSGIKANIAANMCSSRIQELYKSGFTIREIFKKIVSTMQKAKQSDLPYSAFTIIRVLNDGIGTALTYEMPPSILVSGSYAMVLESRVYNDTNISLTEANFSIKKGEGILTVSDGVTYAGIGNGYRDGWGINEVAKYIQNNLTTIRKHREFTEFLMEKTKMLWGDKIGDDLTTSFLFCRKGRIVNIFTGAPIDSANDKQSVAKFMACDGLKIVAGATTAKIVARETGKELELNDKSESLIAPPNYMIEGIDLVTEGAITLNQVLNIWNEDSAKFEKNSPVTDLVSLLYVADRVNFYLGGCENPASNDISFTQTGVLSRKVIVPLLIKKLEEDGKLVVVEEV